MVKYLFIFYHKICITEIWNIVKQKKKKKIPSIFPDKYIIHDT